MKVLILLADGFDDLQFYCCWFRLREEGIQVTVAGSTTQPLTGLHGYQFEPDMPIHELSPAEYDLLLIPGGSSPEKLRQREEAVDITRTFMQDDRFVAVVGHGPQLLISSGAIDGRRVTCSPGIRDDVRAAGAVYRDEDVVLDGNLISCRDGHELHLFCRQLLASLSTRA